MPARLGRLPWLGAGISLLRNPTDFFARARRRYGDTFVVDAFGYRLFCVFSPEGVRALYRLEEAQASFGLATYELVMKRKLPVEMVIGRRTMPHDLFAREDVEEYLGCLEAAVDVQLSELGAQGEFEIFTFARRLGHRLGLSCWAGAEAGSATNLARLAPLFDTLDQGESFVRPTSLIRTLLTKRYRETEAMHGIERIVAELIATRRKRAVASEDYLDRIYAAFSDLQEPERSIQTARDIMLIHMGAQSNLYAALAWTLVNLLEHEETLRRVIDGDDDLLERAASESIRMAQRSITLRMALEPVTIETGNGAYEIAAGTMITTMLSVTNTTAAPGLDRFDPDHYEGRRLCPHAGLAAQELVSTFGHGVHSCPAQRFAISAIRISLTRLFERFELTKGFEYPGPLARQLGGVARADRPCVVSYQRRNQA
jgi:cytochrome P450